MIGSMFDLPYEKFKLLNVIVQTPFFTEILLLFKDIIQEVNF